MHHDHFDPVPLRLVDGRSDLIVPRGAVRRRPRASSSSAWWSWGWARLISSTEPNQRHCRRAPSGEALRSEVRGDRLHDHRYTARLLRRRYDLFPEMSELRGELDVALLPVSGWGPTLGPGHLDARRAARRSRFSSHGSPSRSTGGPSSVSGCGGPPGAPDGATATVRARGGEARPIGRRPHPGARRDDYPSDPGGHRSCRPPVSGPEIAEHGWTEVLLANDRGRSRILRRRRKFIRILNRNEHDECFGVGVDDLPAASILPCRACGHQRAPAVASPRR